MVEHQLQPLEGALLQHRQQHGHRFVRAVGHLIAREIGTVVRLADAFQDQNW
ncbi:MAG: hypothetical protein HC900_02310 [Methylacidiphilales bacterium]|nr:hypothetical protein [Candidatus Methylacidiphilales bacterium]